MSNDTGLAHQGVGQGRLAMVDMSDDRHVPDVRLLVHDPTDLVCSEVHLIKEGSHKIGGKS